MTAGRVSAVLRGGGGGKVDVDTIKLAAAFVSTFDGKPEEAFVAIDSVGSFIEACGSAAKAKAALETYEAVAAVVVKK